MKVKRRSPRLTRLEKLTKGLSGDPNKYKSRFSVNEVESKGRSLFLSKGIIKKDSFVLEYEGDLISHREAEKREAAYEINKEGCYILFFKFQRRNLAIDATRHFSSYARYLNHSRNPNIKFHTPLIVNLDGENVPRIAAYALKDIHEGEEIVFDYGVRDKDISWLKNTKLSRMSELPSDTSESESSYEDDSVSDETGISISLRKPGIPYSSKKKKSSWSSSSSISSHLTRPKKVQPSNPFSLHSGDYGLRFIPKSSRLRRRPAYYVKFETLDEPKKVLRIVDDCSNKDVISIISLSDSESQASESDYCLPNDDESNSISKVMEWQYQNSATFSSMQRDIQILDVKSLQASTSRSGACKISSSAAFDTNSTFPQISEIMSGNMVPKQYTPDIETAFPTTKNYSYTNNIEMPKAFQNTSVPPKSSCSISSSSFNHNSEQSSTSSHTSCVAVPARGVKRQADRGASAFMSDYLATLKRLKESQSSGKAQCETVSNRTTLTKTDSNNDRSMNTNDDLVIMLNSPQNSPEIPKAFPKTESKFIHDDDEVEIILSSDSDLEETIVANSKNSVYQPSQISSPSLSSQHHKSGVDKDSNCSHHISAPPASSPVHKNDSKKNVNSFATSAPSKPNSSALSDFHMKSISQTAAKYAGQNLQSSSSASSPDIIIEEEAFHEGMHSGHSFISSNSATLTSHKGPSLHHQPLSSPPVAVIKPFNAYDGLALSEEERKKLKEILGPHLFSDSSASSQKIQAAISKNWQFFKTLVERGVTLDDIRASVRKFVKAAERERRKSMQQKPSSIPQTVNGKDNKKTA